MLCRLLEVNIMALQTARGEHYGSENAVTISALALIIVRICLNSRTSEFSQQSMYCTEAARLCVS